MQVLVTVDNFPLDLDALPGISAALEQVPPATALFDLLFRFVEDPSGLHLTVQYDATLFTPATVERLVDAVDRVLEALLEQPDTELGDIVLTGAEDLAALQAAWQAVSREEVDFAHQAARAVESPQWPDFLARVEAEGLLSALLLAL